MKKRLIIVLATGLLLSGMIGVASATLITLGGIYSSDNKSSIYQETSGFLTETFNDAHIGLVTAANADNSLDQDSWTWTSLSESGSVVTDSVSGQHASPFGLDSPDSTNYLSVPNPDTTGSVKVGLGSSYNYFGLWWGSIDDYNSLSFYNSASGTSSIFDFGGSQLAPADGSWTAQDQNLYVNFYFENQTFDSFVLTSTNKAFEVDNITVGTSPAPVPEPATMLLFGTGLVGLAGVRFRRKKK